MGPRFGACCLLTAVLLSGCGTDTATDPEPAPPAPSAQPAAPQAEAIVEAPDVTGEDGQDAVDLIEAEGLTASLGEHDGHDPTGCVVEDQSQIGEVDPGADIELTLDCRQVDWENQEGEVWTLFDEAYSSGWDQGCEQAFSNSPDGTELHYEGTTFTAVDCEDEKPGDASSADIPSDVPDDPEGLGEELGISDGCRAAFDLSDDGTLYYGSESFDSSLCP